MPNLIIKAYMTAFHRPEIDGPAVRIREIEIPSGEIVDLLVESHMQTKPVRTEGLLELAFQYGQNEFQSKQLPSLSVGDVIELPNSDRYRVAGWGWNKLAADEDPTAATGNEARLLARTGESI